MFLLEHPESEIEFDVRFRGVGDGLDVPLARRLALEEGVGGAEGGEEGLQAVVEGVLLMGEGRRGVVVVVVVGGGRGGGGGGRSIG